MKITLTRGISGAGKSTWAAQRAAEGVFVVSRDEIRSRYFDLNAYFSAGPDESFEELVSYIEQEEIATYIEAGQDFIIDNVNLEPAYLEPYFQLFTRFQIPTSAIEFRDFPCDYATSMKRNAEANKKVAPALIRHQEELYKSLASRYAAEK